jgi:hypothetical protein
MSPSPLPPELPGVEHRYITAPDGARIHVADAGPADGYRVLAPDLRGAGWRAGSVAAFGGRRSSVSADSPPIDSTVVMC